MSASTKKRSVSATIATEVKKPVTPRVSSRSSVVEFNPDYTYVKKDLTRIAILAGSFITIMVVMSFIIR
jgi:hypothetical protein